MKNNLFQRAEAHRFGLILISAGILVFEINLTRVFAVQQFHHFAFMVVSLGVMGIAGSGLLLALWPRHPPLSLLAMGFASAVLVSYLIINYLPFDSYSIAWDRRQIFILILYFAASALPFLLAGWAIGASLAAAGHEVHLPYAAVFIGSAIGCPLALGIHALYGSEGGIALASALGLAAASVFSARSARRLLLAGAAVIVLALGAQQNAALELRLSPYKPLSITRLLPDARQSVTWWSASSRIDVVESRAIHTFPGLSLNAVQELPQQAALFLDGDGPLPITGLAPEETAASELAAHMPSALAYRLRPGAEALVLQPGAGLSAQIALAGGAAQVSIPRDEPLILQVLAGPYAAATRGLLANPRVRVMERAGRGALAGEFAGYDVIEFSLSTPFRPVTSGAFSLTEDYDLTLNALRDAYSHLSDEGLLLIGRWLGTPPAESARAWATLLAALKASGVQDPSDRVLAFRSMRTATLIAARRPFTEQELSAAREFMHENAYDPIHLPDLQLHELNQYNRLPEPVYHQLYAALLDDPEATIARYDFNLRPPTDGRPYFFHFFRWRQTPEVLATLGLTWQPFGGSGYLVLLALLALMATLALPLMVSPLLVARRRPDRSRPRLAAVVYFAALGAGYLLVEIPLIQRLTLLLDHPAVSLAVVLFTLLLASGIGSLLSPRLPLRRALVILALAVGLLTLVLPVMIQAALPWGLPARLGLAVLLLLAPGFLMGVPFAAGLSRLERISRGSVPWAWAVNGAVSGVSGVLAALAALDWGFGAVLVAGGLCYLLAWAASPALGRASRSIRA